MGSSPTGTTIFGKIMKTNYHQVVRDILEVYDAIAPNVKALPNLFIDYYEAKVGELEELDPEFDEDTLVGYLLQRPQFNKIMFPRMWN